MTQPMFSVFDKVSGNFSPPFTAPNAPVALRYFQDELDNSQSLYFKHPGDYVLFEIGTFELETATIHGIIPKPISQPIPAALELVNG